MGGRAARALLVLGLGCGGAPSGADGGDGSAGDARDGRFEPLLPAELSDREAVTQLTDLAALPVLGDGRYVQETSADRGTGETLGLRLFAEGNRDMNNFACRRDATAHASTFLPYVFDEDPCPEPYVQGHVLARFEGSGRLTRLWMTALSWRGGAADDEVLRFYVDGAPDPVAVVPLTELLGGAREGIFAPPFVDGSARHLAWYYPLVFAEGLVVALDGLGSFDLYYHQVDAVLDAEPRARVAADEPVAERAAAQRLLADGPGVTGAATVLPVTLGAGAFEPDLLEVAGPATFERIDLVFDEATRGDLEHVWLEIRWDDEEEPSIALPLLALFSSVLAPVDNASLALVGTLEAGTRRLSLRLPMPFAERARLSLDARMAGASRFSFEITRASGVPAAPWGNLATEWYETYGPTDVAYHPLAVVEGRGRLVGVCGMLEGHAQEGTLEFASPFNFLEGDERIELDDELLIEGTGTEDLLNGAFYFEDGGGGAPFAQAWGISDAITTYPGGAMVSGCRWYVLGDVIDFQESLLAELEIGLGDPSVLDRYRTVAFYYHAREGGAP